ncbi:MAG: four helix bundle protein [Candidatus Paceibacterota bacterium]
MSNHNDLVIFQKTYDLILWIYPVVNGFPKSQRFVLGQKIENILISFLILPRSKNRRLNLQEMDF